jgi:hypothetical protein
MLDDLWLQRVTNPEGPEGRSALLLEMADLMAESETLWLPMARFEDRIELVRHIVAQGILSLSENGSRVGFQHQTLFEHARARAFAQGHGSLSAYALKRQDSLFIRPTLWSSLRYLRDASTSTYEEEMERLLGAALRLHVRYLLIDFLGQVQEPSDREMIWLVRFLEAPEFRNKVLFSISGNNGWFRRLASGHLPAVMNLDPNFAWPVVNVLQRALPFGRQECLDLINRHWMPDKTKDSLTWSALRDLSEWDDDSVELVCRII